MTVLNVYAAIDPDEPPAGLSDTAAEFWGRLALQKPIADQRERPVLTRIAKLLERGKLDEARVAMAQLGIGGIGRAEVVFGPTGHDAFGLMRQRLYLSLPPREVQAIDRRLREAGLYIDEHGDLLPVVSSKAAAHS